MVDFDKVYDAFQKYQRATLRATKTIQKTQAAFDEATREAREELEAFCKEHGLPIDFNRKG